MYVNDVERCVVHGNVQYIEKYRDKLDMIDGNLVCNLEGNRTQELENLFKLIVPKIVNYIETAEPSSGKYKAGSLGRYHDPQDLKKEFQELDNLQNGVRGDYDKLLEVMDKVLEYSVNTWNAGFLDKLYASNNPIGVISDTLLSVLNTNSHVYTVSPVLSVLENYISRKYARLFFEDHPHSCGGLTFAGGSWSNITSMQMARSLKYPETKTQGNGKYKFAIYSSEHCHYSVVKSAILMGLGSENVFKIPVTYAGTMKVDKLKEQIQASISQGFTPLYINATAGTTVFGSFDPFVEISRIAKDYNCWFHIDGSWGGNVVFSEAHKPKLNGCKFADSFTVNPHKMLGVPTICSFLLVPHVLYFQEAMSLAAPYLFHGNRDENEENFDLADGTMGCGRRADSFKFYMAWLYYGQDGFAKRINHAFEIQKYFVDKVSDMKNFSLVMASKDNLPPCLQVCFYYMPDNCAKSNTEVTRYISKELHRRGKFLVDYSPNPSDDKSGEFFRVVFNSPILTSAVIDDLINSIIDLGGGIS